MALGLDGILQALPIDNGTLQVLLLVVELVLLVATLALLVLNRRETKSRELLMRHFSSVADVITRQEYFVAVIDSIQRSQKTLVGIITGSPPSNEEGEIIRQILNSVAEASKRKVEIRYLLPLAPDRLKMGRLYSKSGARVEFSPSVLISDARYTCVDAKVVLVGIPERSGKNEPTRKGYTMTSESVARLFTRDFEEQWAAPGARTYHDYLRELVGQARASNPSASSELMAGNLGVGNEDVEDALRDLGQAAGTT
ncbi:MAG: hypothetical protein JRN57_01170 [Nitrososphaerota archaeon]|nr:hypothetical protein [Nitrososphaerota archaeon]